MSTSELKYNIFQLIDSINDENKLKAIYRQLTNSKSIGADWYDQLSLEQKDKIKSAQTELREGLGIDDDEARARIKKIIADKKSA